ncbi:MAG: ATP-binding protein [Nitrosomonas sp.]
MKIRRAVMVEGRSEWEAARYFGINRKIVKKMCQYAVPPVIGASASSFHLSLRDSLASLIPFWKLTDKFMLSSDTLRCEYWSGYVMNKCSLGSEQLTGALLDRLTHYVHILEMNGESYRLATSKKRQEQTLQAQSIDKEDAKP